MRHGGAAASKSRISLAIDCIRWNGSHSEAEVTSMVQYKLVLLLTAICTPWLLLGQQTSTLPSGTEINVRADQEITAEAANAGQNYPATVNAAVVDREGHVLIPKGAQANIRAQAEGSKVSLDLSSVTIDGRE